MSRRLRAEVTATPQTIAGVTTAKVPTSAATGLATRVVVGEREERGSAHPTGAGHATVRQPRRAGLRDTVRGHSGALTSSEARPLVGLRYGGVPSARALFARGRRVAALNDAAFRTPWKGQCLTSAVEWWRVGAHRSCIWKPLLHLESDAGAQLTFVAIRTMVVPVVMENSAPVKDDMPTVRRTVCPAFQNG